MGEGVGITAVSWPYPCDSHCSPLTVPSAGSNLGGERWWQNPRVEVLGKAAPPAGLSGFYLPCWLAQLTSSWPQPPEPQHVLSGCWGHPPPGSQS